MKKVLLTGFEPFLEFNYNPSGEIAKKLNNYENEKYKIYGLELPVVHKEAIKILENNFYKIDPDLLLGMGLAPGATGIRIERIAINSYYFNDGNEIEDNIENGPEALYTNLPVDSIRKKLWSKGIPAYYSFHAGTYLCNEVFYKIMRLAYNKGIKGGFIHIPLTHKQVIAMKKFNYPSMDENILIDAIKLIIEESI
ncbi:pyroglutamyl peptidase I [Caldisphaera lagunensis DSM 15908]|uniref:Pyroglutamyl peptidase I n=1 Tax=Caldisphaera lagunensis (strain DSM 15908 / JCM 11604 / ANMR 0165 / IC-154) TaxID=1056495 RepID=L0A7W6_CALLD|nr:pyroglutamyl-peptidase I [Caldisphaera lagunensis]AFZ69926.1 pyroglutamyl peptidase I [Caldisphaera lagunensis DSM 15908]